MADGDAAVAEAFKAGRLPPGITVRYLDESRDAPSVVASLLIVSLTLVVVSGRAFSRFFLRKSFGMDDALAVLGMAVFIAFVPFCVVLINIGSGRHFEYIQYVMTQEVLDETEVLDFSAHLIYSTALLFCRYSGLAFYYRVCGIHTGFLRSIKWLAGFLLLGWLAQMLLIVFHCQPVTAIWPYDWQEQFNDFKCLPWGFVYGINSAVSLLCDFVLFGIPIAMLRKLDMTRKRKMQLACILLPGTLVVAISVVRLILVINGQWQPDQSWIYSPLLAIEVAEIGATLIALSIPGIRPLADEICDKVTVWASRHLPCLFKRKKNKDATLDSWFSDSSTWRNDPTPRQAEFKMMDIEEVLGLELAAIEKYESKSRAKFLTNNAFRSARISKLGAKEYDMGDNRI